MPSSWLWSPALFHTQTTWPSGVTHQAAVGISVEVVPGLWAEHADLPNSVLLWPSELVWPLGQRRVLEWGWGATVCGEPRIREDCARSEDHPLVPTLCSLLLASGPQGQLLPVAPTEEGQLQASPVLSLHPAHVVNGFAKGHGSDCVSEKGPLGVGLCPRSEISWKGCQVFGHGEGG